MTELPEDAINLIKRWEGFRSHWYADAGGVRTIGFGTTDMDRAIDPGAIDPPITRTRGEELLRRSIDTHYEPCVRESLRREATPHQLGAMVSLAYNIGCGAFGDSTLVQLFNAGETGEAADEFLRWKYVGGEVVEGLRRRRQAERAFFFGELGPAFSIEAERVPVAGVERLGTPALADLLGRIDLD